MDRRKSFRYFGAAAIVLLIGAVANTQVSGPGRASQQPQSAAAIPSDTLAALGTNAFSSGVRREDDFSFFEEFLRNRKGFDDGLIDDKTGRWSQGSRTAGPDLQRVSDMGEVVSKPSATHDDSLMGGERAAKLPTQSGLLGAALLGAQSYSSPGFLVNVIRPNAPPQPPTPEVPLPPAAFLFLTAIAGIGALRKKNKG